MFKGILASLLAMFAALSFAAVDVNKASMADLDSIKGIGPATSTKLLDERKASPFKDWADLMQRVPGIGDKRAAKLSAEGLTVNGEAFTAVEKPATEKKAADKMPAASAK